MSKNKKVIIIIMSIILVIVLSLIIIIPIIKKNNIKKEKEGYINNTKELIKFIEKTCNEEISGKNDVIPTYKYEIEEKKFTNSINYNKNMPENGVIELNDKCEVTLSVVYSEYNIVKKIGKDVTILDDKTSYSNGNEIYYNVEENVICNDYKKENSNDGVSTGCMKWYIFNYNKKSSIVTMILDHNTSSNVRWLSNNDIEKDKEYNTSVGAITAINALNKTFSNVDKLTSPKIRLIKASEIAKIIELDKFKADSKDDYFFDSKLNKPLKKCYKNDVSECNYSWLYDHTSTNCKEYGCKNNSNTATYGYWTETASKSDSNKAWSVYFDGRMTLTDINQISAGIRPVVEIQKSLLK